MSLQLSGGTDDNMAQLFSHGKINGYFKASPGVNILLGYGNSSFPNNDVPERENLKRNIKIISANRGTIYMQVDTAVIVQAFFAEGLPDNFEDFIQVIKTRASLYSFKNYTRDASVYTDEYYKDLAGAVMVRYGGNAELPGIQMYNELGLSLLIRSRFRACKADSRLQQVKKIPRQIDAIQDAYTNVKLNEFWERKQMSWLNVTPYVSNSSVTLFDTAKKKFNDTASTNYGIQVSYNTLIKYRNGGKFLYWKIGGSFKQG